MQGKWLLPCEGDENNGSKELRNFECLFTFGEGNHTPAKTDLYMYETSGYANVYWTILALYFLLVNLIKYLSISLGCALLEFLHLL